MISCMISYDNYIMTYIHILTSMVADPRPLAGAVPADMSSEDDDDSDRDHGLPDPHDDDDFGHGGGASRAQARPLDPLARFIQELQDLSSMNGPDISSVVDDLPLPQEGDVSGVSVQEAVAVCFYISNDISFIYPI
jgi:hypothetical protein